MANNRNRGIDALPKAPGTSIDGYYIMMGADSEYGPGSINFLQGKSFLVKMTYKGMRKLQAFLEQNKDAFNYQLAKELEADGVIKPL